MAREASSSSGDMNSSDSDVKVPADWHWELVNDIVHEKCLYSGCDRGIFVHYGDGDAYVEGTDSGWTHPSKGCWYCPEHPTFEGKGWLTEDEEVVVEVRGERVFGEVVSIYENGCEVLVKVNGTRKVYTYSPDEVSPC